MDYIAFSSFLEAHMHLLRFTIGQVRYYHNGQPLTSDAALEVKRHTPLSDKFCLHFFELKSYRRLQTQTAARNYGYHCLMQKPKRI